MRFCRGSKAEIKAPLAGSSLEDWVSFLENSPGGTTRRQYRVCLRERIAASLHSLLGLAAVYIFLIVSLSALVFGFTRRTLWEIWREGSSPSSMAASHWEKNSDG